MMSTIRGLTWYGFVVVLTYILDNEQLARSGVNCFENLVISNGQKFTPDAWGKACHCIRNIFNSSVPHELITWKPDIPLENDYVVTDSPAVNKTSSSPNLKMKVKVCFYLLNLILSWFERSVLFTVVVLQ